MKVYALFANGSASQILYGLHSTGPDDERVGLHFPNIDNPKIKASARKGSFEAYRFLEQQCIEPGERFFASCQFAENWLEDRSYGDSAGLAFCITMALTIHQAKTGINSPGAVAATGVLSAGEGQSEIKAVNPQTLARKIQGALEVLSPGDRLFIPRGNAAAVDDDLRRELADANISLIPVETVEQALGEILPEYAAPAPADQPQPCGPPATQPGIARRRWPVAAAAALLAAALGSAFWLSPLLPDEDLSPAALAERGADGMLVEVKNHLDATWDERGHLERQAADLYRQLDTALHVRVWFHHQPAANTGLRPAEKELDGSAQLDLAAGDLYRFSYEVEHPPATSDSCYLYAFRLDARGGVDRLSASFAPTGPPVRKNGRRHYLPPNTTDWFKMERDEERIVLVAARLRSTDLERAYDRWAGAFADDQAEHAQAFAQGLARRRRAQQAGLGGIYLAEWTLRIGGGSAVDVR